MPGYLTKEIVDAEPRAPWELGFRHVVETNREVLRFKSRGGLSRFQAASNTNLFLLRCANSTKQEDKTSAPNGEKKA